MEPLLPSSSSVVDRYNDRARLEVLSRLFKVLRYGGLLYRNDRNDDEGWQYWHDTGLPIATALSHGSRVLIQLPKVNPTVKQQKSSIVSVLNRKIDNVLSTTSNNNDTDHCHLFWTWLLTGRMQGSVTSMVSTSTNGDDAMKEQKIVFRRLAATHAISYWNYDECHPIKLYDNTVRQKFMFEKNSKLGLSLRDTKIGLHNKLLQHHRHWGMNISMGGCGNYKSNRMIEPNGEFGHVYMYYMSSASHRHGGILVGVEGSEYGKVDQSGMEHTISAKSSPVGITNGLKWNRLRELGLKSCPDKYDSMFVDLSGGWSFLMSRPWNNSMLSETSMKTIDQ